MYQILFSARAKKDFKHLPKTQQRLILNRLKYFVSSPNPLVFAKALTNYHLGHYRFRIGDYRIVFDLTDTETIIILRLGHRREIYR